MKNLKSLFAGILAVCFVLTSCSNDDDNNENNLGGNLQSRWNIDKTTIKAGSGNTQTFDYTLDESGCDKDYLEFTSGNVLNYVVYVHNASNECEADMAPAGTYTRTGNTVVIIGEQYPGTYEIKRLTGSELRLESSATVANVTTVTTLYLKKAANQN
ncbi:MAG TPA: lipocalin family protein [Flavobacterium sp.]|jgi:hypothetical protein